MPVKNEQDILEQARRIGPCFLYRHYDAKGTLLYVGISLNAVYRLAQHRQTSPWFHEIARVDIQMLPDREAALRAESEAIKTEQPRHNIKCKRTSITPPRIIETAERMVADIVCVEPMYDLHGAADVLGMSYSALQRLTEQGLINTVLVPSARQGARGEGAHNRMADFGVPRNPSNPKSGRKRRVKVHLLCGAMLRLGAINTTIPQYLLQQKVA